MSEPQAEPPGADVRSFLPRPGEPVDAYAARLRALHHDLSLVLDAVERGLAAAEAAPPEPPEPPEPELAALPGRRADDVYEIGEEPRRSPPPPRPLAVPPRGGARVEVISTPAAAQGGDVESDRPWSAAREPAVPSQRSPYAEPWVERAAPPARREPWVEERAGWPAPPHPPAELSFAPPPHAPFVKPPLVRAPAVSPVLVAALILGWLTTFALILAVAFGA